MSKCSGMSGLFDDTAQGWHYLEHRHCPGCSAPLGAELRDVLAQCIDRIDCIYGPPGSNNLDRGLLDKARAVLAAEVPRE